jgi:hypothetical protein
MWHISTEDAIVDMTESFYFVRARERIRLININ